ncbi:MAG TPA: lysozyme inhibitor LprI family protein, partial [Skermanella sp.]|nr:lysozyme inhibitor LprI family protein [Skermanella sp.]
MRVPVPIAALASLLAWTSISHAASFDCAKAAQPAERLICSDSALSNLDESMAAEYSRARAAVSEEGRKQLRDNQRSWLKYVSATCTKSMQAL